MKLAVLGAGRMGSLHAANTAANPRMELGYVVDPDPSRAAALADPLGARPASVEQVLDDPAIAGVIVATSTDALLETALACLKAGKPVFCEKPLSLSLERLNAARAEILASAAPLFVAFNRRFDPHLADLQERLARRELGEIETLHIVNHDPAAPDFRFAERSGGLFRDFTVHDFDTAAWMLDEPIDSIFAMASCLVDPRLATIGDVDTAKIVLRTHSGKLCLISNSRRTGYGYDQRAEAFCERGALRVDNLAVNAVTAWTEQGSHSSPMPYAFPDRYAEAYRNELSHFADIIEGKSVPRTGIEASISALTLAEAALESLASRTAISLAKGD